MRSQMLLLFGCAGGLLLLLLPAAAAAAAAPDVVVLVRRPAAATAEIERRFWAVADPAGPDYASYLSAAELLPLRAAPPASLAAVVSWLQGPEAGCARTLVSETQDAVEGHGCARAHEQPGGAGQRPAALEAAGTVDFVHWAAAARPAPPAPPPPRPANLHRGGAVATAAAASSMLPKLNNGTPARQRAFYGLPAAQATATNATNLQMVWGCGTFGVSCSTQPLVGLRLVGLGLGLGLGLGPPLPPLPPLPPPPPPPPPPLLLLLDAFTTASTVPGGRGCSASASAAEEAALAVAGSAVAVPRPTDIDCTTAGLFAGEQD